MVDKKMVKMSYSLGVLFFLFFIQGCASLGVKSNSDTLAKLSNEDFVLSLASQTLNFDLLQQSSGPTNTLLRLIPSADQALVAKLHQGNRSLTQPIQLNDPSRAIATSLAKHYQNKNQLRFIAKGTIKNIDPDYLKRALKKGRYVFDVRVTSVFLVPDKNRTRFYPEASIQFSVIDAKKAKVILEDSCTFSDRQNVQRLAAFGNNNGKLISSFLSKYANDCLNYFAIGKPIAGQTVLQQAPTEKPKSTPKPAQTNTATTTTYQLGGSFKFVKDAFDRDLNLAGYSGRVQIKKPLTPEKGLVYQATVSAYQQDNWPEIANAIYVASMGLGVSVESQKLTNVYYNILGTAKIGQYRENILALSTNSLGVEAQAVKVFFDTIVISARYGLDKHFGQTTEANAWGHQFGVAVGFKLK